MRQNLVFSVNFSITGKKNQTLHIRGPREGLTIVSENAACRGEGIMGYEQQVSSTTILCRSHSVCSPLGLRLQAISLLPFLENLDDRHESPHPPYKASKCTIRVHHCMFLSSATTRDGSSRSGPGLSKSSPSLSTGCCLMLRPTVSGQGRLCVHFPAAHV